MSSTISSPPQFFECQKYIELECFGQVKEELQNLNYVCQLKYDGIWAQVVIENNVATVYSKTHKKKDSFPCPLDLRRTVIIAEYMYGSQWSQREGRAGRLYCFDCVMLDGMDISALSYETRIREFLKPSFWMLDSCKFVGINSYSLGNAFAVWDNIALQKTLDFEGLVFRSTEGGWDDTIFKLKREVEDDYVIMGFTPGKNKHEGRLGALLVGQYDNGILVQVMAVGGGLSDAVRAGVWDHSSQFLGQVCTVVGKARFDSGALRHPNFVRFRYDKLPTECKLVKPSL